jgi:hypothetical protein
MPSFIDLTGQRFGRLLVIGRAPKIKHDTLWRCYCECGVECVVAAGNLRRGATRSCGCMQKEMLAARRTAHGHTVGGKDSRMYATFYNMHARCENPNNTEFKNYGARGVSVCSRWSGIGGFATFIEDMGEKPTKMTLERKDVNGNYEPSNCCWATWKIQANNKRSTVAKRTSTPVHKVIECMGVSHA